MNVRSSFSNKHPKLETAEMSTNRWMGKQMWYTIPWNTNQQLKGNNYRYTQQYEWISTTCWLTEGGHKSVYCVISLIWILEKGNLICSDWKQISHSRRLECGMRKDCEGVQCLGLMMVFYILIMEWFLGCINWSKLKELTKCIHFTSIRLVFFKCHHNYQEIVEAELGPII